MKRTFDGSGVNVAAVKLSGSGGACGTPLFVTNAKFAHSSPAVFKHAALFVCVRLSDSPNTAIAAHHFVGSHDVPTTNGVHPGG
jgi:hypothetical protein